MTDSVYYLKFTLLRQPPPAAPALRFFSVKPAVAAVVGFYRFWARWFAAVVLSFQPSESRSSFSSRLPLVQFKRWCFSSHLAPSSRARSQESTSQNAGSPLLFYVGLFLRWFLWSFPSSNVFLTSKLRSLPLRELPPGLLALKLLMWVLPNPSPGAPGISNLETDTHATFFLFNYYLLTTHSLSSSAHPLSALSSLLFHFECLSSPSKGPRTCPAHCSVLETQLNSRTAALWASLWRPHFLRWGERSQDTLDISGT